MIRSWPVSRRTVRNTIMKPVFAAVLALACVVGSTDGFARGAGLGGAHGFAHGGGMGRGSVRDFGNPAAADARFRNPDSGPARGTTAGPRDQRADVAAVAPGHVAARAGWVVVGPASAFCDTAHEPSPGLRPAGYCANSRRRDRLSVRFAFLVLESGLQGCSICDPDPALSHGSGKVFGGSVH